LVYFPEVKVFVQAVEPGIKKTRDIVCQVIKLRVMIGVVLYDQVHGQGLNENEQDEKMVF
jgi:hypothetical protein